MTKPFFEFLPESAEDVLALEPEELGEIILQFFCSLGAAEQKHQVNRHNFTLDHQISRFGSGYREELAQALMEAWVWLEREMLVAPRPGQLGGDWYFVTRRGRRLAAEREAEPRSWSASFPQGKLHPLIAARVRSDFIRKDYDSAILKSFKEVEVAVRAAAGLPDELVGTDLMRRALNVSTGALSDAKVVAAERQATSDLFAGAIGLFKNPHSHRHLGVSDADRALEVLGLASYLMHLVDAALARKGATP